MTDATSRSDFVLTLLCPDTPGIVHAVSGFLLEQSGNIMESQQFGDAETGRFFMRVRVETTDPAVDRESLRAGFGSVADRFGMTWELWSAGAPYRTLIMVSRFGHCLNDLLFRASTGALPVRIAAVVSNHKDFAELTGSYGVDFVYLPVAAGDAEAKAKAEAKLLEVVESRGVELVVLARYMQVLSNDVCKALEGRIVNIHHSFLPSFKGAKPYHQAHARGVKLIGATAHYVTADLDEGPIIEQEVARVGHGVSPEQLVAVGRDVECQVLARAVKWHAEHRVLLNGNRTVVFA
jgi:formyltetrahydrofolate deformylase